MFPVNYAYVCLLPVVAGAPTAPSGYAIQPCNVHICVFNSHVVCE